MWLAAFSACTDNNEASVEAARRANVVPPPPQKPRVVALGNIRGGRPPSHSEVALTAFLFGAEPQPPLALVKPAGLATRAGNLLICDTALAGVFEWSDADRSLRELHLNPRPTRPNAIATTPAGDLLVVDAAGGRVLRYDATGRYKQTYRFEASSFRPGGAAMVGDDVWVTNVTLHRIEVFNADTGEHRRSIGERGHRAGQFGVPLALAVTPDGQVCVADMLNARVQVLDADGKWVRDIGRPGDRVGTFGRPKSVAVGPDGVIFVVDAASQRVHAFAPDGRALLAFGEPNGSPYDLSVPGGIEIVSENPTTNDDLPDDFETAYYVLVSEQIRDPGVRVYAWGRDALDHLASIVDGAPVPEYPRVNAAGTRNPHWSSEIGDCAECHSMLSEQPLPIAPEAVDDICLRCHDGDHAIGEAHPVGREARTASLHFPEDWPLVDGRLACLTCHDIIRQCDTSAVRPKRNPSMLRAYDPEQRLKFCTQCHVDTQRERFTPHLRMVLDGKVNESVCQFCHVTVPEIPADGQPKHEPNLRADPQLLCQTCHVRHWDYAPGGHVDRELTPAVRKRLNESLASGRTEYMPLHNDHVTCYTCHNPHEAGLFPAGTPLDARAGRPEDAAVALRANQVLLCLNCHDK